ncbi:hypothetical protein MMPV_003922 [Pyropia vietnamensis]
MALNCIQAGTFFMTPTTLLPLLASDLGLTVGQAMLPLAAGKLAYVVLLVPGGVLVDAIGPRAGVLGGIAGLAVVTATYAVAVHGLWLMGAAHVALATFSCVSGVPVYSLFIAGWFGRGGGMGLAMGLVLSGYSLAGTAVPALIGPIAGRWGWRVGMAVVSAVLTTVGLPLTYFFLIDKDDDEEEPGMGHADPGGVPSPVATLKEEESAVRSVVPPAALLPPSIGTRPNEDTPTATESLLMPGHSVCPQMPAIAESTASAAAAAPGAGEAGGATEGAPLSPPFSEAAPAHHALLSPSDAAMVAAAAAAAASARRRTFLGFAASYALMQYTFGSVGENLLFFLTIDRSMPLSVASLYFSSLNGCAFLAKLAGGHLGDRFNRFRIAAGASLLTAIGVSLLFASSSWATGPAGEEALWLGPLRLPVLTTSPWVVLAFTIVFGLGYGATFNCLYSLGPVVFGRRDLGRVQSALFGCGLLGNATGAVVTGALRTSTSTYDLPFLLAAAACTANVVAFSATRRLCENVAAERLRMADAAAMAAAEADAEAAAAVISAVTGSTAATAVAGGAKQPSPVGHSESTPLLGTGIRRHTGVASLYPPTSGGVTPSTPGGADSPRNYAPPSAAAFVSSLAASVGSPGGDGPLGRALLRASRSVSASLMSAGGRMSPGSSAYLAASPGGGGPAEGARRGCDAPRMWGGGVPLSVSRDSLLSGTSVVSSGRPPLSGGGLFPAPLRRRHGGRTPVTRSGGNETAMAAGPASSAGTSGWPAPMGRSVSVDWLPPPGSRARAVWSREEIRGGAGGEGGHVGTMRSVATAILDSGLLSASVEYAPVLEGALHPDDAIVEATAAEEAGEAHDSGAV